MKMVCSWSSSNENSGLISLDRGYSVELWESIESNLSSSGVNQTGALEAVEMFMWEVDGRFEVAATSKEDQ